MSDEDGSRAFAHQGTILGDDTLTNSNGDYGSAIIGNDQLHQWHVYTWPNAKNLPYVFPDYLCRNIIRQDNKAAVSLKFGPPDQCHITVDIQSSAIQHVAMRLFEIHIEDIDEQRIVFINEGQTMVLGGPFILRGVGNLFANDVMGNMSVNALMGSIIGGGFQRSPKRNEEINRGVSRSECVTFEVVEFGNANHHSRLDVIVDVETLSAIRDMLWSPCRIVAGHQRVIVRKVKVVAVDKTPTRGSNGDVSFEPNMSKV
nr:uncharacterized protein CTRU02_05470 [Colletotrichum truncatum]KAF6793913.1 hypothetical protein CTRU02_05470 [Colletotrichum truncatum]